MMYFYKGGAYGLTFVYALFIFSFEASFYNDDALFLSRGIENFSVVDFSPHFPGYVAVVILGKMVHFFIHDAAKALFIVSATCAILLPLLLFFYVNRLWDAKKAFVVFLISLSSSYLMNLGLSMLSDSIGLFFFFLSLYMYERKRYKWCGFIASIALFARPSYFILFFLGFCMVVYKNKEAIKSMLGMFLLGAVLFLLYTFAYNGILYIQEGIRFIQGHFALWGVGQNAQVSWWDNILLFENLPFVLFLVALFHLKKEHALLWLLFGGYFLWILFAQNPQNIRHMIPLIFLANIIIVLSLKKELFVALLFLSVNLYTINQYKAKFSPLDQIIQTIHEKNNPNQIIISNYGVEILREKLPNKVMDNYYIHSAQYIQNSHDFLLITTTKPTKDNFITFKGRFVGERDFYLKGKLD